MIQAILLHHKLTSLALVILLVVVGAFPAHPIAAQSGGTHTVQSGENLFRIALRYNTTVEALAAANGITDPAQIYAGQILTIPGAAAALPPAPDNPVVLDPMLTVPIAAAQQAPVYHTVQPGETLNSIAQLYGLTWTDLASANGLGNPNQIFGGQQLLIPGTSAPGTAAAAPPIAVEPIVSTIPEPAAQPVVASPTDRTHIVQPGENLAAIARLYGVSWPTIAGANNLTDPNHIYSGQTLIIPASNIGQDPYLQPNTWTPVVAAAPTIATGKQIIVDLSDQTVYAYENNLLLRAVLVSTGLPGTPTVQGDYRIYTKYASQTMTGPGYYLPGVPYVMYFYKGYSLHGTYWHNNFGQPMSHGCVNMPTPEAEWFFTWSEIGTPVHVQW